jgi:hypothetical protein
MATTIVWIVDNVIRGQFYGSYRAAASSTPAGLRFVWVGVMVVIAGLAALLVVGWNEIGAGAVSATERRPDPSYAAAAPQRETPADRMEALRQRGLDLLRADFPEDEPSPSLARGDRLEVYDATIQPAIRVATAAGQNEASVALSVPLPSRPTASKPAEAKEKHAAMARPAHRRHARRTSRHLPDRVRVAHAKYVQVPGEPQVALGAGLQSNRSPTEENKLVGWFTGLPEAIVPSSWKGGWEKLWAKGNGR